MGMRNTDFATRHFRRHHYGKVRTFCPGEGTQNARCTLLSVVAPNFVCFSSTNIVLQHVVTEEVCHGKQCHFCPEGKVWANLNRTSIRKQKISNDFLSNGLIPADSVGFLTEIFALLAANISPIVDLPNGQQILGKTLPTARNYTIRTPSKPATFRILHKLMGVQSSVQRCVIIPPNAVSSTIRVDSAWVFYGRLTLP
eukprot:scaffold46464_cov199-Amphora_coffeaeformis.AAC.5